VWGKVLASRSFPAISNIKLHLIQNSRKHLNTGCSLCFRQHRLLDPPSRPWFSLPTRIQPKSQEIDEECKASQRQPRHDKDPEIAADCDTSRIHVEHEEVHAINGLHGGLLPTLLLTERGG